MNLSLLGISLNTIGILTLVAIGLILIGGFVWGLKTGFKKAGISFLVTVASLAVAIFVSAPLLSLFDKWFNFSLLFVDFFFAKFSVIQSMNTIVNSTTISSAVTAFSNTDVGLASWIKDFLIKIFGNTVIPEGQTTTLSLLASKTFSYFVALFIVAVIVFFVVSIVLNLILGKILKLHKGKGKLFGGIIGILQGVIISMMLLVTFSTVPFFGTQTDFIGEGFKQIKFCDTAYTSFKNFEDNLYIKNISWKTVNNNIYGKATDIGTKYVDSKNNDKYSVEIEVDFAKNDWNEKLLIKSTNQILNQKHSFVYANSTIYVFDEQTVFATYKVKDKTIIYKSMIKVGESSEEYSTVLKINSENLKDNTYKLSKYTKEGVLQNISAYSDYIFKIVDNQFIQANGLATTTFNAFLSGDIYYCYISSENQVKAKISFNADKTVLTANFGTDVLEYTLNS